MTVNYAPGVNMSEYGRTGSRPGNIPALRKYSSVVGTGSGSTTSLKVKVKVKVTTRSDDQDTND